MNRLAEIVGDGYVAGVDSSRVMVDQARRRNAVAIARGKVDLRHGSVALLPFPDGMFDRALAVNSQEHWPHPLANLREVRRVVKPGGFIVIAEQPVWDKTGADDCRYASELAARLAAAGFVEIEVISRRMRPAPTICVRGRNPQQDDAVGGGRQR
jgi:ubiquinone/menaquinone biosynthesis C-methylase UbiE